MTYHSVRASQRAPESIRGFTLLELLIVVGIIAVLLVLLAPAFTTIKSGADVTSAAYTIKGVLDTARTYAKANDTYTWVGFFEEDVSQSSTNPATAGVGRVVMSIVASKDGTNVATTNPIDPTKLIQVDKLTKIDNTHLTTFTDTTTLRGTYPGTTFDTRPLVTCTYIIGDKSPSSNCANSVNSTTPFQYPLTGTAQYTFVKAVQFGPSGETVVDNSTSIYSTQTAAEIGLTQTHGNVAPTLGTQNNGTYVGNMVAIQFTGEGGNVTIYRK